MCHSPSAYTASLCFRPHPRSLPPSCMRGSLPVSSCSCVLKILNRPKGIEPPSPAESPDCLSLLNPCERKTTFVVTPDITGYPVSAFTALPQISIAAGFEPSQASQQRQAALPRAMRCSPLKPYSGRLYALRAAYSEF